MATSQSEKICDFGALTGRTFGGIFRAGVATISVTDVSTGDAGKISTTTSNYGLVIGVEISLEVDHTLLHSLFNSQYFLVQGFPKGTATFHRVVAPNQVKEAVCSCQPKHITINFKPSMCYVADKKSSASSISSDHTIILKNAIPTAIVYASKSEQLVTTFSIRFMFSDME